MFLFLVLWAGSIFSIYYIHGITAARLIWFAFLQLYRQLMPLLETLYNAPKRSSNQIYMVLIILLILSQDSSFNASIHKLVSTASLGYHNSFRWLSYWHLIFFEQILPSVPWYQERLLHQTSLGSLMVIILIRTVKYNLSKLRVWLDAPYELIIYIDFFVMLFLGIHVIDFLFQLILSSDPWRAVIRLSCTYLFFFPC